MFKSLCNNKEEQGEIYTSFPPQPQAPVLDKPVLDKPVLEKKKIIKVDAIATCRLGLERESSCDALEITGGSQRNVLYSHTGATYSYILKLEYSINYKLGEKELNLNGSKVIQTFTNIVSMKDYYDIKLKNRDEIYMSIVKTALEKEVPKAIEREKIDAFLEEIQGMEDIILEFNVEVESKC